MGLMPDVFDSMEVAQFIMAWFGYNEKIKVIEQGEWERTRWIVHNNTIMQIGRKHWEPMTVMFPFPWDRESTKVIDKPITQQERKERVRKLLGG